MRNIRINSVFAAFVLISLFVFSSEVLAQKKRAVSQKTKDRQLLAAVEKGDLPKVKLLLKQGANPNAENNSEISVSALGIAIFDKNNFELAKILIEKGADINWENEFGITLLNSACHKKNLEIVKLLIEKGIDVNYEFPLRSALPDSPTEEKISLELFKVLMDAGANVNAQNFQGKTILMLLADMPETHWDLIKFVLSKGVNPNITNIWGEDALELARINENKDIFDFLKPLTTPIEEKRAKLPGKFFNNNGIEIYYRVMGAKTGTPLFVLHGGPGFEHRYFLTNSVFEELGKIRPIVFFDQRGAGNSPNLTESQKNKTEDLIEDIERLRTHLGYDKIDVFGHSWGGFLAVAYGVAHPQKISRLIICDSSAAKNAEVYTDFQNSYPELYEEMNDNRNKALGYDEKAHQARLLAYTKMLFYSPQKRDEFIEKTSNLLIKVYAGFDARTSAIGMDLTGDLPKINFPTLILHGKHDKNIIPQSSEEYHKGILKSELIIFEKSGHLPFVEEPEKFVQVVENFLSRKP